MKISSAHKQNLRSKAHSLKPVIIIGNHGLTAAVQTEINQTLEAHELIKIRVNATDREERQLMTEEICREQHAELIQSIGHIIVIYRKNIDTEN
jgi:RNA-binding protein